MRAVNFTLGKARGAGRRVLRQLTAASRTLPDFLIIGAQKAGTTSLYDYLVQHPDVAAGARKEVHFFDNAYSRGELWYRSFFPLERERERHRAQTGRVLLSGDATPYYLFHPLVPARVARLVPHARIVVLLRDPVARAFSHYAHERSRGYENLSFEEAIESEPARLRGEEDRLLKNARGRSRKHQRWSYVARGFYAEQLERWFACLPREQFLVLGSENFFSNPAALVSEVFAFLKLQPCPLSTYAVRNPGRYMNELQPATARKLRAIFQQPNEALFKLVGTDFGWNQSMGSTSGGGKG